MRYKELIESSSGSFDITASPGFKSWFSGSVVVDAEGKPLRVYHGTYGDFTTFSHDEAAYRGGLLAFFSASPEMANAYAATSPGASGANVMPVYLQIRRPFDYRRHMPLIDAFWKRTGGVRDQHDIQKIRIGLGLQEYHQDDKRYRLTQGQFTKAIKSGSWDALESSEFIYWLRDRFSCDGITTAENGHENFGVFKANQIKSAIGNNGQFSMGNHSIIEDQNR